MSNILSFVSAYLFAAGIISIFVGIGVILVLLVCLILKNIYYQVKGLLVPRSSNAQTQKKDKSP